MTVKELIEELKKFPEDMPVAFYDADVGEYNVLCFYPQEVCATAWKKKGDCEWVPYDTKAVGL